MYFICFFFDKELEECLRCVVLNHIRCIKALVLRGFRLEFEKKTTYAKFVVYESITHRLGL